MNQLHKTVFFKVAKMLTVVALNVKLDKILYAYNNNYLVLQYGLDTNMRLCSNFRPQIQLQPRWWHTN